MLLYLVFSGFDYHRLIVSLRHAQWGYALLIPATIAFEQWVRAWKWRQILAPISATGTLGLYRALMAGYVPGLAVGMGTSVVTRAWLVARREKPLTIRAVVASIVVDRLVDNIAFAAFLVLALATTVVPDSAGVLRLGLVLAGLIGLAVAGGLLFVLFAYPRHLSRLPPTLARRLPRRWDVRFRLFMRAFRMGVSWPRSRRRQMTIVFAALLIKGLATVQLLWAGLALGIRLPAGDYLFIMVFLGLWVVVGFVVRIPGSGILVTVFILGVFGIARAPALAMTLMVAGSFLAVYGGLGAIALWLEGIGWRDLPAWRARSRCPR